MLGNSSIEIVMKQYLLTIVVFLMQSVGLHIHVTNAQPLPAYAGLGEWDPYTTEPTSVVTEPLFSEPVVLTEHDYNVDYKLAEEIDEEINDGQEGPDGGPGGPGGFGGPDGEPGYGVTWYPTSTVIGQGTELGIVRNRAAVDVPLYFKDSDAVMASLSVDNSHFSGTTVLPDTLRAFPSDLWNISFGLKHMHQFSNEWSSMLMFDIASPSDKPFQSSRDMSYTLGGFLMKPAKNGRDSWMLGAIYSPSGSPNFPIPLVAYNWKPSEAFEMNIGLPFSMSWKPTDKLSLDVSGLPYVMGGDAIVTYELSESFKAYGGYQYLTDQYFLSDRVIREELFYAIEQRLIVGIRRDLWKGMTLDVNGGYAFDRHYGEGDDQSDLHDLVELESGAFLSGRLILNF
jgi:hypothetical protein